MANTQAISIGNATVIQSRAFIAVSFTGLASWSPKIPPGCCSLIQYVMGYAFLTDLSGKDQKKQGIKGDLSLTQFVIDEPGVQCAKYLLGSSVLLVGFDAPGVYAPNYDGNGGLSPVVGPCPTLPLNNEIKIRTDQWDGTWISETFHWDFNTCVDCTIKGSSAQACKSWSLDIVLKPFEDIAEVSTSLGPLS